VGCRRSEDKDALLRFVARDGALEPDPAARLPGRGAYLHRDESCWRAAVRRGAFRRALRGEVAVPTSPPF
jgi:uncharacterized protein